MKTIKTTFVAGIIFVLMALMTLTTLTACGGSGGSGHDHPSVESDGPEPVPEPGPEPVPEPGPEPVPEPGPTPLSLMAIPEDGEITVSWPKIPELLSSDYTVSCSEDGDVKPSGNISQISEIFDADSGTTMLEATITGLENGTTYRVQVDAGDLTRGEVLRTVGGKIWYVSPLGNDGNNGLSINVPLSSVREALKKVAKDKADYPSKWKEASDFAQIVIQGNLTEAITINLGAEPPYLGAEPPYPPVTLLGKPDSEIITGTLTISGGNENSPEVTLTNITLNGGGNNVVTVSDGKLVIQTGAVITGGGDGVVVNSGGAVTMTGGKVCADEDPDAFDPTKRVKGVVVNSGGTFNMNGGSVWNNENGVRVNSGGTFHMTGGDIYHNGLGVWVETGAAFTKTSGIVYGDYEHMKDERGEAEAEMYYNWDGSVYNPYGSRSETLGPHNNYP